MSNKSNLNAGTSKKTWTGLFIGILGIQILLELVIGFTFLFSFSSALESGFGITYSPEIDVLGIIIGLYLLLLTTLMILSCFWTNKANYAGITLGIILGIFLLIIGLALSMQAGNAQGLLVDGSRGLLTAIFAYMAGKEIQQ